MTAGVLVVAAHPDDEVLGCGGAIARWADEGRRVDILILGEGVTSRFGSRDEGLVRGAQELSIVREHAGRAARILGAASCRVAGLPDNRFDSVDLLDVIKEVERAKDETGPAIVLTHHGADLNIDHRICQQAVLTAFRPQPGERCREVLFFETLSSTEWQAPGAVTAFTPNRWVLLRADQVERKSRAMAEYPGELRTWPHPRSLEAIEVLARHRGSQIGGDWAEAFVVGRIVE